MGHVELLKDVYGDHFVVGFAQDRIAAQYEHLIQHFDVVTPETRSSGKGSSRARESTPLTRSTS